eukprot:1918910-Pyramimonas_sp.AAC.2
MAWHAGIHRRSKKVERPDWAHGGLKYRGREEAILTLQTAQWRCREAKVSHVTTNFDCTNAFASTKRSLLEQ